MSKTKAACLGFISIIGYILGFCLFIGAFFTSDTPVTLVQLLMLGWFLILYSLRFSQEHFAQHISYKTLKKVVSAIYFLCTFAFFVYAFFLLQEATILFVVLLCLAVLSLMGFVLCLRTPKYDFLIKDGTLLQFNEGSMHFENNFLKKFFLLYGIKYAIIIPSNVTKIGKNAFTKSFNVIAIRINESVSIIEEDAFYSCGNLRSIFIPKTVIHIGSGAFSGCKHLKYINIDSSNPHYFFEKGILYEKESKLHTYLCSNLDKYFNIPNFVTEIKSKAFYHYQTLKVLEVSPNIITIAKDSFSEKLMLKKIYVTVGNKSFNSIKDDSELCSSYGDTIYTCKNRYKFGKLQLIVTIFFVLLGVLLFFFAKYLLDSSW